MSDTISINGELRSLSASILVEVLEEIGVDSSKGGVAVALNGEVVPRADWPQTSMKPNDKVEIVHIVRGG